MTDTGYRLIIGGERVDADGGYDVINPATEQAVGTAPDASVAQAEAACEAARAAFDGWAGTSVEERCALLARFADLWDAHLDELVPLVQAETGEALENLDAIIAVDGVDGVFIGPADLAASLGYPGEPQHPKVVAEVESAIRRVRAAGKAPGVLTPDETLARRYMAAGSLYTAVGVDAAILARHCDQLAARFANAASR